MRTKTRKKTEEKNTKDKKTKDKKTACAFRMSGLFFLFGFAFLVSGSGLASRWRQGEQQQVMKQQLREIAFGGGVEKANILPEQSELSDRSKVSEWSKISEKSEMPKQLEKTEQYSKLKEAEMEIAVDFEALRSENPDVIAWLRIPDTRIDYPIVWKAGDNESYLFQDFYGRDSIYGTLFLDGEAKPDFSGWNHPIYGHHMRDGAMFGDLERFRDAQFLDKHRYFTLYTPQRAIHLRVIACLDLDSDGSVRKQDFYGKKEFTVWIFDQLGEKVVDEQFGASAFDEQFRADADTQIPMTVFTLVTCSYEKENARTVVFAVEDENLKNP